MAKKKKQQVRDSEYTRERDSVYGSSRFQGKFQSLYSGDSEDPYFGEGFRTGGRKKTKKAKATTRPADRYADRYADRSADRFSDRYGDSYAERNADLFDGRRSDRYAERSADRYEGRKAERTNNRKKTSVSRVSEEKKRSIAASFGFVSEEEYEPDGQDAGKRIGSAAGDIAGTLAGGIFSWTKEFIQFAGGDKQKRIITLPQRN